MICVYDDAGNVIETDEDGHQPDKGGTLGVLKSGDLRFKPIKLSNMKVYAYVDAATITGPAALLGKFAKG